MKKQIWVLILLVIMLILSACNGENDTKPVESDIPEILEVQLEVPDTVDVNGKVEMKAIVAQGNENVADADKVEFEVWEEGNKEESRMIESKNNNDGTYDAEVTFDRAGVFTVQVHVTARSMHSMPKKSVIVGSSTED